MTEKKRGLNLLIDPSSNKSMSFNREERRELGLCGLLPYSISTMELDIQRVLENLKRKDDNVERYIYLSSLQDRNERLYYRAIIDNIDELLPIIYTPTVGQACKEFSHIFRHSKGFHISPEDKGQIRSMLDNWPEQDIRVIVVTDGERVLGLGDLGADGMGIPIGKLALYVACGGIHPKQCLPVMLDVGTNNDELLNDLLYLGFPHRRLTGSEYFELADEFITAVQDKYPNALIQFEDFLTPNAYELLRRYRDKFLCFNDDIQGTAAVALAGVYASLRITKDAFKDLRIMFLGAGSAATGIADLMVKAFIEEGLSEEAAYQRLWFVDINGLVVSGRKDLMEHNAPYAHDHEQMGFVDALQEIQPQILIGATGAAGTFTKEVIETMCRFNERPVVFALSNPTWKAECTAEEAYQWSKGKVVFASGSPFKPVNYNGKVYHTGQGNNVYIFPGIGLGAISCGLSRIQEEIFLTAAKTLADLVSANDINAGSVYPPLKDIRTVSLNIAKAVAEKSYELGLARREKPDSLMRDMNEYMYDPKY